ncbi:hypothetical protein [Sphingobacterium multivorum]|uniref:hypothetical protein n=1 Tax=Sphingobacterium multivorum TaxID=28454 RepID=UPI0028963930|nr:hypothetical protein [Sphingobacterium multivorum]
MPDSDSTRTQHGQNTVAGQICPEHGTKQVGRGVEGSQPSDHLFYKKNLAPLQVVKVKMK